MFSRIMLIFFPVLLCSQPQQISFTFLPEQKLIPIFPADTRSHRISINKLFENNELVGSMGGRFPIENIEWNTMRGQFSIASTMYAQLKMPSRKAQIINHDYFVDITFDIQFNEQHAIRFARGHTSQHMSDDALLVLGYPISSVVDYVRDYYQLGYIHHNNMIRGYLYFFANYNFVFKINTIIRDPLLFQAGGEVLRTSLANSLIGYIGFDLKVSQVFNYAASQNYQIGIELTKNNALRKIRLAYNYQTGLDERGQFFTNRIYWNTIGAYFEL